MMARRFAILITALLSTSGLASPVKRGDVQDYETRDIVVDGGWFSGVVHGEVDKYLGIPYAQPPVGHLRFQEPLPNRPYTGPQIAKEFGPACIQQTVQFPGEGVVNKAINAVFGRVYHRAIPSSEDCLTLNVMTPHDIDLNARLPVVVFLFGGGFQFGGTSIYDGGVLVTRSIDLGEPIIYVSVNYRVSFLGFPSGREAREKGAGNLGLYDQRLALRWVQKYISKFGGDPNRVTLWGQSAGAMSTAFQMVANDGNTEGLFRAAWMQSGSTIPIGTMDDALAQSGFDLIAKHTGCDKAEDSFECLRKIPIDRLQAAIDTTPQILSYHSVALPFVPRVDGKFFKIPPMHSVLNGNVANIPFVSSSCLDEGTAFSFGMNNVTTDAEFMEWARTVFMLPATDQEMNDLAELYPSDPLKGSPYENIGVWIPTSQFTRIASFQGDLVFQAPRRFFLENTAWKQNAWSYLEKEGSRAIPLLGSFHGADIINLYGVGMLQEYLVNFVNNMDPNVGYRDSAHIQWPRYEPGKPQMLTLSNMIFPQLAVILDNYREDGMSILTQVSLRYY